MLDIEDLKVMWLDLMAQVDRLASERQQYLEVFERSTEAYVVTDAAGTIETVNAAAVDILQRRRRHLQGKPFVVLVALERRADFRERLRRLAGGNPAAERSWRTILESPGLRTDVALTARPVGVPPALRAICWRVEPLE